MISLPKHTLRRLAALVALTFAFAAAPRADAQELLAPPRGPSLGPAVPSFPPTPAYDGLQPVPAAAPQSEHDYWIVSSRDCPQLSCTGGCAQCPLSFYRCDPRGCPYRAPGESFFAAVQPGVPVCIIVHGSFTEWGTVCQDARQTSQWLRDACPGSPAQFLFYSWPSEALLPVLPCVDIGLLGRRSAFNGMYLAQLVSRLPPDTPVTLIGHSLGTRAIASCLHLMGGGAIESGHRCPAAAADPRRVRAVFAAAALDHHWLVPGERYGCALPRAELLVNLRNSEDLALALYPFRRLFSHRALGRSGVTSKDRRLMGSLGGKFIEFDVTASLGAGHIWPRYYRRPQIAQAIAPYVFFADAAAVHEEPIPQPAPATIFESSRSWDMSTRN